MIRRIRNAAALRAEARDYIWLDRARQGASTRAIAARAGVSARAVAQGIARARARELSAAAGAATRGPRPPELVLLFPVPPLTPASACPHRGPIAPGSHLCCAVCSRSGMDDHPALRRDPRTDPRPDPKAPPPADAPRAQPETRKERRRRIFACATPHPTSDA